MFELPPFDTQTMYDAETTFSLLMSRERLAKILVHYEVMKEIQSVPGAIVECGVFKGTSFVRFAKFRELLGGQFSRKLIGFDVFSDDYPETAHAEDQAQRTHWIETAGGSSISTTQLIAVLDHFGISNFELVAGDATKTIPEYCDSNKGLKIALLNIDIDFVEPTYAALSHFYDRVSPGGMILLDNYAGEGVAGYSYHGDTVGVDRFLEEHSDEVLIAQYPFAARPCYIKKA